MLPGQTHADFLALSRCCDIFLDAPGWSGGRTTLEAIACGLLPMTLAGSLMRQRHTAAILSELGLHTLIAHNADNYVRQAARLGNDTALRQQLTQDLASRKSVLLKRHDVIQALLAFCETSRHKSVG